MLAPVLIALQSLAAGETCPAPVDVQARVRTILHLAPEQQLSESFLVERHEAGLFVVLKGADGSVIGERTLPVAGSCDELAQAAAVVLGAWLTDVHPDFAGALPVPALEPPAQPSPEAKPEPQPASPPAQPRPAPVQPRSAPKPDPSNQARFDWGLGIAADVGLFPRDGAGELELAAVGLAPAALASFGYGPERSGFGLTALAFISASREQPLGTGLVHWRRWPLAVGPGLRLTGLSLRWDLGVGPVAAWVHLEGERFNQDNATKDDANFGGFFSLRASGTGALAPFGLASLQIFPGKAEVYVDNLSRRWSLPLVTFLITLGARFAH